MTEVETIKHDLHDSYPSVVNLHNPKQIEIFTNEFPELKECLWAIEEKYHGFNFQVTYLPGSELGYEPDYAGSREIQVTRDTKFFGAWAAIDRHKEIFEKLRNVSKSFNIKMTFYMEMFGGKVSKGVNYNIEGPGKYKIRFVGMKLNGNMLPPKGFYSFMWSLDIPSDMIALPIAIVKGIQAASDFNPIFHSLDAIKDDTSEMDRSYAEGFVAKPLDNHFINKGGKNILIKKKNERFEEFAHEKTIRIVNPDVVNLREIFKEFLNENRINSTFSKIGPIVSKLQMAQYIRMITDDARIDFHSQYSDEMNKLSSEDQKSVLNVGNFLALQLLAHINSAA